MMPPTQLERRALLRTLAGLAASCGLGASAAPVGGAQPAAGAMPTRPIPSTGEALPLIGLGTWQTFDVGADAAARAPLREVLAAFARGGGKLIDSSPMYGRAEEVVGDLVAELGLRERLFLATKVWTPGRDAGVRQMEQSLQRLRADHVDLMQVHNLVDVATHARTLRGWKARKRARYIGVSHYTASAHGEVERVLRGGGWDFLQINYSLGEREAERRILPLCRELGVAVIVNRPFAEGALFSRVRGRKPPEWAAAAGIASWGQYFLRWILGHPAVTCVIPATARLPHLLDNLAAAAGPLPDEALRRRMAETFDAG
jgi:aryl-alcohol dehydrogenase-like predicted oxidoreductase